MMSADPPENSETGQPPSQSGYPHHTTGHPQPPEVHSYQESIPRCEAKGVTGNDIPPPSIQISSPSTPAASSVITTKAVGVGGDVTTVIPTTTTTTTTTTSGVLTSTTAIDTVAKIPSLLTTANATSDIPIGRLSQVTTATSTLSSESLTSPKDLPTTTSLTTTSTTTSSIATTATTAQSTSTTAVNTSTATSRTTIPTLSHPQFPQQHVRGSSLSLPPPPSSWTSTMGAVAPIPCDTPGELLHSTVGVNGHALPQGAGETRDVSRNPLPLPVSHSASSVRHRERLIGPVIARVPPPPLRLADARRERQRLASGNQRLMSKPVKRKLWEVDHDKLEVELEEECNQIMEEEEKRFKERWEEIGIDNNPHTPTFYHSEVIDSTKRKEVVASTLLPSSSLPSPPSSSTSSNSATPSSSKSSSSTKPSETKSPRAGKYSARLDSQKKSEGSSVDSKSSSSVSASSMVSGESAKASSLVSGESAKASSIASPEALGEGEGIREGSRLSKNKTVVNDRKQSTPDTPSSPLASPASSSSSTLNLSTSSTSSSGVWSLESTPTPERLRSQQTMTPAQTITPQGSDTPTQGRAPPTAGRIAPTQETNAPTQRPTTRSCRQRRTSQRTDSGPPRKHLRM